MDERGAESPDERRERRNEQGLSCSLTTFGVAAMDQIELLAGEDYPGEGERTRSVDPI